MKENCREIFYCDECQPIIGSALREVHTSYTALSSICQHRVALRSPHVLRTGAIRQLLVQIIYQQVQGQPRNNSKSPEAPQNFLKALASHQNQPECKDQKDHHDQWPLSWELRWQQKYLTFPRVHGSQCQVGLCAPLGWVKTHQPKTESLRKKKDQKHFKPCQRHNGPEGWVLLTKVQASSNTNLGQILSSESQPSTNFKISTSTRLD